MSVRGGGGLRVLVLPRIRRTLGGLDGAKGLENAKGGVWGREGDEEVERVRVRSQRK